MHPTRVQSPKGVNMEGAGLRRSLAAKYYRDRPTVTFELMRDTPACMTGLLKRQKPPSDEHWLATLR